MRKVKKGAGLASKSEMNKIASQIKKGTERFAKSTGVLSGKKFRLK